MNYDRIKEAAKMYGGSVTDWLALAPANDPFYVGTPKDVINAQWFRELWDTAVAEDEEDFLFSTERSYYGQIAAYKAFKNGDN